jgi:ApaG protein
MSQSSGDSYENFPKYSSRINKYALSMTTCTTNGITVSVFPNYLSDHSNPAHGIFIFSYTILIENGSPYTVQLLRRRWVIFDSNNTTREVTGDGVVGMQPTLAPGQIHEYSSFCELRTNIGRMEGQYTMLRLSDDALFEVEIPAFQLVPPYHLN